MLPFPYDLLPLSAERNMLVEALLKIEQTKNVFYRYQLYGHPVGRVIPNGITLLGTAFFTVEDYWLTIQKNKVEKELIDLIKVF